MTTYILALAARSGMVVATNPPTPPPAKRRGRPPGRKATTAERSKISQAVRRALASRPPHAAIAVAAKATATRNARAAASGPSCQWRNLPTPGEERSHKGIQIPNPSRFSARPLEWWIDADPAHLVGAAHVWSHRADAGPNDALYVSATGYGVRIHGWRTLAHLDPFRGDGTLRGTRYVVPVSIHLRHPGMATVTIHAVTLDREAMAYAKANERKWRARDASEYLRLNGKRPPGRPPKV